jgi:hypothetical protein
VKYSCADTITFGLYIAKNICYNHERSEEFNMGA